MVRIVSVADTHTFEHELEVPDGDVFVHAGDMLRGGSLRELAPVAEWIQSLPHAHKIVVAGNHDFCFQRERDEACALLGKDVTYLEDQEATIAGLRVYGSPWQPEFHDWAFNLPRGEPLRAKWDLIPSGLDLLITHGPPHGFHDRSSYAPAQRAGCRELLVATQRAQPRLHVFGHIHEDGGATTHGPTTFANVTTWECERAPTVFDISGGEVKWVSVPSSPSYSG